MDFSFYLAFPTCVYLFAINNKYKEALCKACQKLTRKVQDQMCEAKFLHGTIIQTEITCKKISL